MSVVRYCINGKIKLSATVLTRLCVNITNLPLEAERDALREGSRPTESGNTPPANGAGYSEKGGGNHKKKTRGISISHLNNREKTKIADALRQTYPLTELLHVLGLARSSYFYHRAALKAGDKYATIRTMLTDIFNSNYQCYGYRRLHAMLRHEGGGYMRGAAIRKGCTQTYGGRTACRQP